MQHQIVKFLTATKKLKKLNQTFIVTALVNLSISTHNHANKNNDNQKVTINLEDIYDLWSQPEINTQRR